MNALQLYRLTRIPEANPPSVERQVKRTKVQEPVAKTTEYTCFECHHPVHLTKDSVVQCSACCSRVVRKIANLQQVTRTYSAV